jgi:hypothetical protein
VQVFYWTSTAHSFSEKPGALVSNGKCFLFGSGGIVFWADLVGPKHVYDSLKKWSQRFGDFYKPSKFLEERATGGIPLVRALSSFFFFYLCIYLPSSALLVKTTMEMYTTLVVKDR